MRVSRVLAVAAVAGCYHPDPQGGAPCATSADCPPGLVCDGNVCTTTGGAGDGGMDVCPANVCQGNELVVCGFPMACAAGCVAQGEPHCGVLVPSNGLTPALLDGATGSITEATNWDFDADDGRIRRGSTTLRASGTGVIAGIGFTVVDGVGVFTADSFVVPAGTTWTAHGDNAVALYAAHTIDVNGTIDVGATGNNGGPGGFSGGTTGANAGCRGHFGAWQAANFGAGGGGAGGVTVGGDGAASTGAAAGAGGPLCTDHPTTIPLFGASGGGAGGWDAVGATVRGGSGGGGGGAIALVAMERVTISSTGVVGAPGGGGQALANGDGGGGGGGGGAVFVEAPVVTLAGAVTANGGSGAAPSTNAGTRGHLGDSDVAGGGAYNGKFGGRGCANTTTPGDGQDYTDNPTTPTISRGGGGGGACGRIELKAVTTTTTGSVQSPPATQSTATVQ